MRPPDSAESVKVDDVEAGTESLTLSEAHDPSRGTDGRETRQ
jgi:hypothetical protein